MDLIIYVVLSIFTIILILNAPKNFKYRLLTSLFLLLNLLVAMGLVGSILN